MKKLFSLLFALVFAVQLAGCGAQTKKYSESFDAMDTFMQVDVYGDEQAMKDIKAEITRLDGLLSTTGEDSDVSKINKNGSATVDEAVLDLAEKSLDLCRDTGGALDITVYPIVEEWGFISKDYKIPDEKTLSDLLQLVDHNKVAVKDGRITLPKGAKLDFGARRSSTAPNPTARCSTSAAPSLPTVKRRAAKSGRSALPTPKTAPATWATSPARIK